MSDHTGQHAGTSSQEHHNATSHGASRMHNGNAYYYYASDMRIAGLAQEPIPIKAPTETATENGAKLWRAARFGQLPRVQRLLKLGADLGYRCNEYGTTALHQAAGNSHKDVMEALLESDASVDDMDHEGKTALHYATSADIVKSLVMAGADVDHEDREGKTPGRVALVRKNTAVVDALIEGRADPSKIFEPREGTDSSRFETSGKQSEGEETDLQDYHVLGAPDPPEKHKQDNGGRVPALTKELLDVDMHLPIVHIPFPFRSRNHSSVPTPDERSTEHSALQPHTPPTLDDCDKGSRLIIAINLRYGYLGDVHVLYAVESEGESPRSYANNRDDEHGMTKSSFLPHKDLVRHMMYDDRSLLPLESHMQGSGSRVVAFDRTGKPGGGRFSNYLEALGTHITTEIASERGGRPINSSHKEILIVVPDLWSDSLKATILQAAKAADVRDAALITTLESAVLYALCCKPTEVAQQILDGDIYLVCDLSSSEMFCHKQEVVSTKPFRLREFGQSRTCSKEVDKGTFDMFKTQAKKATERAKRSNDNYKRWVEDIGRVARSSLGTVRTEKVKAILLFGISRSNEIYTAIQQHCPGLRVICCYAEPWRKGRDKPRDTVLNNLRGAITYQFMK